MDPTEPQARRVKKLRSWFGNAVVHPHAPDPQTGIMRVDLDSIAGLHELYYNREAELVDRSLIQRLFDMPQEVAKPRNAQDN